MASTPPSKLDFDPGRVNELSRYNGLKTNEDRMRYMFMVSDYMAYLRSYQSTALDPHEAAGEATVINFIDVITATRDLAWPLAQQVVPEFQQPVSNFNLLREPLRTVMTGVIPYLPRPRIQVSDPQRLEEDLLWHRWRRQIEYIGFLAGCVDLASEERRVEVQEAIETIEKVSEIVSGLGRTISEDVDDGHGGSKK